MMCAGTLMIADMPTYATIGETALILLVAIRLVQSMSVGSEYGTSGHVTVFCTRYAMDQSLLRRNAACSISAFAKRVFEGMAVHADTMLTQVAGIR